MIGSVVTTLSEATSPDLHCKRLVRKRAVMALNLHQQQDAMRAMSKHQQQHRCVAMFDRLEALQIPMTKACSAERIRSWRSSRCGRGPWRRPETRSYGTWVPDVHNGHGAAGNAQRPARTGQHAI